MLCVFIAEFDASGTKQANGMSQILFKFMRLFVVFFPLPLFLPFPPSYIEIHRIMLSYMEFMDRQPHTFFSFILTLMKLVGH